MSMMLTLIQAGWTSVRSSVEQGRRTDALTRLKRLLAHPDVPTAVAADAHRLAGELQTDAEHYAEARRHLRTAAALEPAHARTYYLWGLAYERDPHGCDRHAARCFRKASRLEPANALYQAAFGRAAVRCDAVKTGVRELLAAANTTPGDLAVLRVVTDGLLDAGRLADARRVLTTARFLCRDTVRQREWTALVERVQFEAARGEQRETRGATRHRQDAEFARDGGRVVLPFIRVETKSESPSGGAVRRDVVSFPRPHFPRLRMRKADR
jgi:tetratricopeptide (TPR) repeat protein